CTKKESMNQSNTFTYYSSFHHWGEARVGKAQKSCEPLMPHRIEHRVNGKPIVLDSSPFTPHSIRHSVCSISLFVRSEANSRGQSLVHSQEDPHRCEGAWPIGCTADLWDRVGVGIKFLAKNERPT